MGLNVSPRPPSGPVPGGLRPLCLFSGTPCQIFSSPRVKSLGPQGRPAVILQNFSRGCPLAVLLSAPATDSQGEEGISELFQNLTRIVGGSCSPCLFFHKSPQRQQNMTHTTEGKVGWAGAFQDQMACLLIRAGAQASCLSSQRPGSYHACRFALGFGEELAFMDGFLLPCMVLSSL